MIYEFIQIQKWFMTEQGVSRLEDIKADDGDYIIPIKGKPYSVTIKDNGLAGIRPIPPVIKDINEY